MTQLRTDQKFARWMLPCVKAGKPAVIEARLCVLYNTCKLAWSVEQIRVAAKLARKQMFNSVDHLHGFMVNALRNLDKGKALDEVAWVEGRKILAPPDETGFRDIVTGWFICAKGAKERGPYRTREEAEGVLDGSA